jgi:hypothetical protein
LESTVKDLQVQLTEQEESANVVIAKWQESCNALEEKNGQLLSALESCGVGDEGVISQEALTALQERLRETERALARAREDMKEDDDAVLRWQGMRLRTSTRLWNVGRVAAQLTVGNLFASTERVAQLESAGEEFLLQISQQELEAKVVIAKWQESCTGLEKQNTELVTRLEVSAEHQGKLQVELQETHQTLNDAKARLREDEDVVAKWQGTLCNELLLNLG